MPLLSFNVDSRRQSDLEWVVDMPEEELMFMLGEGKDVDLGPRFGRCFVYLAATVLEELLENLEDLADGLAVVFQQFLPKNLGDEAYQQGVLLPRTWTLHFHHFAQTAQVNLQSPLGDVFQNYLPGFASGGIPGVQIVEFVECALELLSQLMKAGAGGLLVLVFELLVSLSLNIESCLHGGHVVWGSQVRLDFVESSHDSVRRGWA